MVLGSGLSREAIAWIAIGVVVGVVAVALGFEPAIRSLIARDGPCLQCHADSGSTVEASYKHPEGEEAMACVERRKIPGFMEAAYACRQDIGQDIAQDIATADRFGPDGGAYSALAGDRAPASARRAFRPGDRIQTRGQI